MITYTLLDSLLLFYMRLLIFYLYAGKDDCPKKVYSSSKDKGLSFFGDSIRLIYFLFMRQKYNDAFKDDVEFFFVIVFVEYLSDNSQIIMNPFGFLS